MAILRYIGFITLIVLGIAAVGIGTLAGLVTLLIRQGERMPEPDELEQGL